MEMVRDFIFLGSKITADGDCSHEIKRHLLLYSPTLKSIQDGLRGKTIALTRQNFVSKVMSLLFNMLSKFVITFLPRSECLLISWLPSPSVVILEPKKIKPVTVSIVFPSICYEVVGPDAMNFIF